MNKSPDKPFFSIIITTYNRINKLKISLESVLNQTFTDYEILVMDDGSTDGTAAYIKNLNNSKIKYFWSDNSGGPAKPRNDGINFAQSNWICFLDADDTWYQTKLVNIKKVLDENVIDIVCHDEYRLNYRLKKKDRLYHGPYTRKFYEKLLIYGNRLSTSAVTINKKFIIKHNIKFNESNDYIIVEDYDFWLKMAEKNAKFYFISSVLGEYNVGDDNLTFNIYKHINNEKKLLHDHVFCIQKFEKNKKKLFNTIVFRVNTYLLKHYLLKKNYFKFTINFIKYTKNSPFGLYIFILGKIYKSIYKFKQSENP